MKWRWFAIFTVIIAGLFASIIIICVVAFTNSPKEPTWQGKTLSEWMFSHVNKGPGGMFDMEGESAIREIGTNGLPTLMRMLQSDQGEVLTIVETELHGHEPWEKPDLARHAIRLLGSNAYPLIPELISMTSNSNWRSRYRGLRCLSDLRPEKAILFPVLERCLSDTNTSVGVESAWIISRRFPEEVERLDVYKRFPNMARPSTNSVGTNGAALTPQN